MSRGRRSAPFREWLGAPGAHPKALRALAERAVLHPLDRQELDYHVAASISRSLQGDLDMLRSFVEDLADRYEHDADLGRFEEVQRVRVGLGPPPRGPGVLGIFGEFRRGDAVSRWQGDALEDGILIEAEPRTEHAVRFGRMVAVAVLGNPERSTDRWYLDDIRHSRDFGRPW